ncbi:hypothetical protein GCM10010387_31020 [Streptomyces inusitatus]|uniref:Uncharacterized protein n=1 Tax=Streptomyces inusitatus TaxID=68221 RepID=A0A918Q7A6_9ACTN|nr:cupin domain-containing protein [Streptomyces inusitatus]GGZ34784.1 hypothetical protein GCM10010387_31020 [Streptomyces inusitatus]
MEGPTTAGVLAGMAEAAAAPADRGGALWRLAAQERQLDANLIRVPPGEGVPGHVEPDLDVLLCVVTGDGELETDAGRQPLAAGAVAWLPHGTRRAVSAGREGLVYVTAHRRRPGMSIRGPQSPAPVAAPAPAPAPVVEGGEAACLLGRICPSCDRPAELSAARYCAHCGTAFPG